MKDEYKGEGKGGEGKGKRKGKDVNVPRTICDLIIQVLVVLEYNIV